MKKCDKLRRRLHSWLSKDYPYFKEHYNMIAIDWSKQQALDADPKAIQQINFSGNLNWDENRSLFHYWKCKRSYFRFFARNRESILNLSCVNIISTYNIKSM